MMMLWQLCAIFFPSQASFYSSKFLFSAHSHCTAYRVQYKIGSCDNNIEKEMRKKTVAMRTLWGMGLDTDDDVKGSPQSF